MRQVPTDFYDRQKFETEKRAYLEHVAKSDRNFTASQEDRFNRLSFEAFAKQYQGSQTLNVESLGTGSIVYVGHVAVLEIWDGKPFVIEAVSSRGVVRQPYENWLASRPGEEVWHGRVADLPQEQCSKIPAEAKKYLGRPYEFFNLDLNDDSGFYCSKLVWLAIFRSLQFAIDDDPESERFFWFSPKQLMNARRVQLLYSPGSYLDN
ncbi:YiiX/YebB-like N1pC/P60 family cysteine hydrolase [Phyllobacterium sp. NPDC097923]|uniref:YiiX/YebB-like N1pC/P60 family cysteine hydrolase n=1 Tax=Phyllobacterium sp. NPDC097923 TaxID=3364404 RepID=UPI00383B26D6